MVEETLVQGQGATYMHYQKGHSGPSSITRDAMMMAQVLFRNIVAESEAELEELGDTYPLNAKYVVIPNNLSDAKDFIRNEPIRSFLLDRGNDRIEEVVGVPARSAMAKKNYHKALALEEQILLVNAPWSNQLQPQNPVKGPLPNFVQNAPEGVKISSNSSQVEYDLQAVYVPDNSENNECLDFRKRLQQGVRRGELQECQKGSVIVILETQNEATAHALHGAVAYNLPPLKHLGKLKGCLLYTSPSPRDS